MRKIHVFQHVAYEPLGTLHPLIKERGFRVQYTNFAREPHAQPCLERASALIILGGPMNVDEVQQYPHLEYEVQVIQKAMQRDIPILGICLGAQLIAKASGAQVTKNPQKEIGWYDLELTDCGEKDPLLCHLQKQEKIFQWHGDTFSIPHNSAHLAKSNLCSNQAFRLGDKIYGFQFHLEVDEPMIHRWIHVNPNKEELEALHGVIDPQKILQETPEYITRLKHLSQSVFGTFLDFLGYRKSHLQMCSR